MHELCASEHYNIYNTHFCASEHYNIYKTHFTEQIDIAICIPWDHYIKTTQSKLHPAGITIDELHEVNYVQDNFKGQNLGHLRSLFL